MDQADLKDNRFFLRTADLDEDDAKPRKDLLQKIDEKLNSYSMGVASNQLPRYFSNSSDSKVVA